MRAHVYVLRCADGSYDIGITRADWLEKRIGEHQAGTYPDYTSRRRPVTLVWSEQFERLTDAIATERRLKGWSRAKKEALGWTDAGRCEEMEAGDSPPHSAALRWEPPHVMPFVDFRLRG